MNLHKRLICLTGVSIAIASSGHAESLPETLTCKPVPGQYGSLNLVIKSANPLTIEDPLMAEDSHNYQGSTNGSTAPDGSTWQIQGGLDQEITITKTQLYRGIWGEQSQYRYVYTISADRRSATEQNFYRNKGIFPGPWNPEPLISYDCLITAGLPGAK